MKKLILLSLCFILFGIQQAFAIPFKLSGHIIDSEKKDITNLNILLFDAAQNKITCETKTEEGKGTFSTICDLPSQEYIKQYIKLFISASAPTVFTETIHKPLDQIKFTSNEISIGGTPENNVILNIKKISHLSYEEIKGSIQTDVTPKEIEQPTIEEDTNSFNFSLLIEGDTQNKPLQLNIEGKNFSYLEGNENKISLNKSISEKLNNKTTTVKLSIPYLNVERNIVVTEGEVTKINLSKELKEYYTYLNFPLDNKPTEDFTLNARDQILSVSLSQVKEENGVIYAEKICNLSNCPFEINYNNKVYHLDKESLSYKVILYGQQGGDDIQNDTQTGNGVNWGLILGILVIIILAASIVLFKDRIKNIITKKE